MQEKPERLYLDLMKKALSFTIWPEPPKELEPLPRYGLLKRQSISLFNRILQPANLVICKTSDASKDDREEGKMWPSYAHTMVGLKRLDNIQHCIETVLQNNVDGDFIETGVWRGGTCILMRAVLAAYGIENRKVYVADSFEGLPKPSAEKYPADKGDRHYRRSELAISKEEVESNFAKYGLLDDQVVFLQGWFKDTLPKAPIEKLAILRLDGDMYESTIDALNNLYFKLSPGGFCIIDDYFLEGCRKAVDDFRSENGISEQIETIDWGAVYWVKGVLR